MLKIKLRGGYYDFFKNFVDYYNGVFADLFKILLIRVKKLTCIIENLVNQYIFN